MTRILIILFSIAIIGLSVAFALNQRSLAELKRERETVYRVQGVIILFHEFSSILNSVQIYTTTFDSLANNNNGQIYSPDRNLIDSELIQLKTQAIYPEQKQRVDTLRALAMQEYDWLLKTNVSEAIATGQNDAHVKNLIAIQQTTTRGIKYADSVLNARKLILEKKVTVTAFWTLFFGYSSYFLIAVCLVFGILQFRKRQQTDRFLASVLNTSLNGIISYKPVRSKSGEVTDFRIIYANEEIQKHNGVSPADIVGKTYKEAFPASISHSIFDRQLKALDSGESDIYEINYADNNVEHWFKVKLARNGEGLTTSFINISDIKKFEEQLKLKIAQLEQSNIELEQFAYIASHDLQEPLRKIQTFADLVNKRNAKQFDKPSTEYMARIISSANRLSHLINDVLNYSRLAKTEEAFSDSDLDKILDNVLVDFELAIIQKNARIQREKLPVIEAYALQMNQLFYNLLNNSLKFAREGISPVIEIKAENLSASEIKQHPALNAAMSYTKIVFKDNGIGFDPEFATQIFTIFKRLHNVSSYPGSGIGLALCKKIAVNHHGDIYATSQPNEGSSFHIILPLKQPVD